MTDYRLYGDLVAVSQSNPRFYVPKYRSSDARPAPDFFSIDNVRCFPRLKIFFEVSVRHGSGGGDRVSLPSRFVDDLTRLG